EIVRLASQPELQAAIRPTMMRNSRSLFNWERWVDQWESWALGIEGRFVQSQYAFQIKHAVGNILNVESEVDWPELAAAGCSNGGLHRCANILGLPTRIHVQADGRQLPFAADFDSVILGDILEHCNDDQAVRFLMEAKRVTKPGGKIILTVP